MQQDQQIGFALVMFLVRFYCLKEIAKRLFALSYAQVSHLSCEKHEYRH